MPYERFLFNRSFLFVATMTLATGIGCNSSRNNQATSDSGAGDVGQHDAALDATAAECRSLSVEDCTERAGCVVVEGWRFLPEKMCFSETREPYACDEEGFIAGGAFSRVVDPEGVCWLLNFTYDPPDGYRDAESDDDCNAPDVRDYRCGQMQPQDVDVDVSTTD
jgi:hypothetical protein